VTPHTTGAPPELDDQMLADWAAVGIRRLQVLLARHAAFCEFLRRRGEIAPAHDREDPCRHRCAP
jgi:hypothetical protein